jgi:hypothetical protein
MRTRTDKDVVLGLPEPFVCVVNLGCREMVLT